MPKALKHFSTSEINYMLDTGEIPDAFMQLLEEAITQSRAAPDGCASVSFFVDDDSEEGDE